MISRRNLLAALPAVSLSGQSTFTDGEVHGDPPYLLEEGWTSLLNGKDLSGWVS